MFYRLENRAPVPTQRAEMAARIDLNENGTLEDEEIRDFVHSDAESCHGHDHTLDTDELVEEAKLSLTGRPNPAAAAYHSYDQAAAELADLEARFPHLCQRVSLGKTAEGRDIWALRITENVQDSSVCKTGVVITGCHHAREWMSVEVPLHVAGKLLNDYGTDEAATKRLHDGEIWIVPVVNPDGYEYSRNQDNWWRKNRRPVGLDAMGKPTNAIGVDLNRNYWDGRPETLHLYRPDGDTPSSTSDDFSSTSDNPRSDTYRGPSGASEIEVKALLDLELGHRNIRGVLDHHSYGNMILYPWGHTYDPVGSLDSYRDIGSKMNQAMDNSFQLKQSSSLYPAAGESDDCHHANGIVSFTLEIGRSFQPKPDQIAPTCERVGRGNIAFIDEILRRADEGLLPART